MVICFNYIIYLLIYFIRIILVLGNSLFLPEDDVLRCRNTYKIFILINYIQKHNLVFLIYFIKYFQYKVIQLPVQQKNLVEKKRLKKNWYMCTQQGSETSTQNSHSQLENQICLNNFQSDILFIEFLIYQLVSKVQMC